MSFLAVFWRLERALTPRVLKERGFCGREIAGRYSRRRLRVDIVARATSRRINAAAIETRQLASWAEETSTIASRRGASSNTYTEHLSSHCSDQASMPRAPTQLTLDELRAGAGVAEGSVSEKHRAPPDCDAKDSWASAAPGSVAARMLISRITIFVGH
jgi:hypothetical protein